MNNVLTHEFQFYRRCFVKAIFIFVVISLLLLTIGYFLSFGFFIGGLASFANLSALAFAYLRIVVQKKPLITLLWPLATFLFMCGAAGIIALKFSGLLLGFALGLTTPLIFGILVSFMAQNPVDQQAE